MLNLEQIIDEKNLKNLEEAINKQVPIIVKLNKNKLDEIYKIDDLNEFINNSILTYPFVSMNNFRSSTCKYDLISRKKDKYFNALNNKLSKKNILYRIAKGDTLIVNSLQEINKRVLDLLESVEKRFNSNCNINLYYSYKNTKGINVHFDLHDVFAIQIYGNKYWELLKPTIKGDVSKPIEKSLKPDFEKLKARNELLNYKTEEGDLLYIPKSIWHFAYTKENSSLHFALGLKPLTINKLIENLLNKNNNFGEMNIYSNNISNIDKLLDKAILKIEKFKKEINKKELENLLISLSDKENIEIELD